jgi:hypothetical protein
MNYTDHKKRIVILGDEIVFKKIFDSHSFRCEYRVNILSFQPLVYKMIPCLSFRECSWSLLRTRSAVAKHRGALYFTLNSDFQLPPCPTFIPHEK